MKMSVKVTLTTPRNAVYNEPIDTVERKEDCPPYKKIRITKRLYPFLVGSFVLLNIYFVGGERPLFWR